MGASRVSSLVISIAAMVILTRLLDPEDFGEAALAMVLFSASNLFTGLGMGPALVHSRHDSHTIAFQAFVINCLAGSAFFLLVNLFMQPLADLLGNPDLAPIMRWLSLLILIAALTVIPESLLRKEMKFGAVSRAIFISTLVTHTVAIVMAVRGFGVWSLVWGDIIGLSVHMTIVWFANASWYWLRPVRWNQPVVNGLIRYGLKQTGSSLVNYFNSYWDDWLVGRNLGTAALGYYTKAYVITNGTIVGLSISVLNGVFFPSYARIQNERQRLQRAYLKSLNVSALAMAPLSMGILAVAPELVPLVFGAKWIPMIPTLQIFTFMALVRPLAASTSPLFQAVGHPEYDLRAGVVVAAVMIPLAFLLLDRGIEGVALAVVISYVAGLAFNLYQMNLIFAGVTPQMIRVVAPSIVASAIMVGAVLLVRPMLYSRFEPGWFMLFLLISVGFMAYLLSILLLQRSVVIEIAQTVRQIAYRRKPPAATEGVNG